MNKVRVIIFFVLIILSLIGLDRIYTFALLHNQNLKLTSTTAHPRNVSLLVHGPCEPLWIVSPAMIDAHTGINSYNLAQSHSDFADNYLHLYLYFKKNRPPDLLLLFVTPESFDTRFNTFNTYHFAPYLNDSLVRRVVEENDPDYARWLWLPFMRYAYYGKKVTFNVVQGLKHYVTGRTNAYYPDGFEPPARRVWGNHQGKFAQLYEDSILFRVDPVRKKYLLKLISFARDHGIEVLMYESPVLRESIPFQPNRNEMVTMIRSLAEKHGLRYIQFSGLEMANHREYFNSTLTLNMRGVELFNDTLGKFLNTYCRRELRRE